MGIRMACAVAFVLAASGVAGCYAPGGASDTATPGVPSSSSTPPTEPSSPATPSLAPTASSTPATAVPPTAAPTITPRTTWAEYQITDGTENTGLDGTIAFEGALYAYGRGGFQAYGVWRSVDGMHWTAVADLPVPPASLGGGFRYVVDAGGTLVALAWVGNPGGGGIQATPLYASSDGEHWGPIEVDTAGLPEYLRFRHLAWVDDHLVAVSGVEDSSLLRDTGFWISRDLGRTWQPSSANEGLGTDVKGIAASGGVLAAAGNAGEDPSADTEPVVWISRDGGVGWERHDIGRPGYAQDVFVTASGEILVFGWNDDEGRSVVWRSEGNGWAEATLEAATGARYAWFPGVTTTPTGFVATTWSGVYRDGKTSIVTSTDGVSWRVTDRLTGEVVDASWSSLVGLVLATEGGTVWLGPTTYP